MQLELLKIPSAYPNKALTMVIQSLLHKTMAWHQVELRTINIVLSNQRLEVFIINITNLIPPLNSVKHSPPPLLNIYKCIHSTIIESLH